MRKAVFKTNLFYEKAFWKQAAITDVVSKGKIL